MDSTKSKFNGSNKVNRGSFIQPEERHKRKKKGKVEYAPVKIISGEDYERMVK